MSGEAQLSGPDLARGVSLADLPEGGQLLGHSGGEPVLVVRKGEEIFAIGATCTHYGGPLAELGGGRAPGADRRAERPRKARALRRRPFLLEPALRRRDLLRRTRADVGLDRDLGLAYR